ncbi:BET1 [Candida pseudojiufengensis]|uniref:BET1 n=1 Tax=Candida pseudojiufengensis TaxID=497109 RepID=UPI002224C1C6|nr:BET1 [Candida pseudojiufengensis]KAI5965344.1 BET1 [Candida pseudojiufengensis]
MSSRYTAASGAHQRSDLRTQLFNTPTHHNFTGIQRQQYNRSPLQQQGLSPIRSNPPSRNSTSSPYDQSTHQSSQKYNESLLNSLESQNDEEIDSMGTKINMLKNLGEKMGIEINKSNALNNEITNSFEKGKVTLKNTYNKMIVMSQRAGISWKMWLVVFGIVFIFFFYIWIL